MNYAPIGQVLTSSRGDHTNPAPRRLFTATTPAVTIPDKEADRSHIGDGATFADLRSAVRTAANIG